MVQKIKIAEIMGKASKDEINKIESKIRNLDYIKQINSNKKLNPYEMFWINIMN